MWKKRNFWRKKTFFESVLVIFLNFEKWISSNKYSQNNFLKSINLYKVQWWKSHLKNDIMKLVTGCVGRFWAVFPKLIFTETRKQNKLNFLKFWVEHLRDQTVCAERKKSALHSSVFFLFSSLSELIFFVFFSLS